MIDLGDAAVANVDPGGMLAAVEGSADQWDQALANARAASGFPSGEGARNVLFCGMGGSGISGDALAALSAPRATLPVAVVKGYEIPAFTGPDTLMICASYSGNTEETLSCFDAGVAAGARIVVISTGGAITERARAAEIPVVAPVPGFQPRAAFPSLLASTLVVADRLGILPGIDAELDAAGAALRAFAAGLSRSAAANPAVELAERIGDAYPVVWGQDGVLGVAALRWRCQLNENSKMPGASGILPELDHNEIVGYDPGLPGPFALVVLRTPKEHPRIALRIDATLRSVEPRVASVEHVRASGSTPLEHLLTAAAFGDFVSVYHALMRGVDPTPVTVIEQLKKTLA